MSGGTRPYRPADLTESELASIVQRYTREVTSVIPWHPPQKPQKPTSPEPSKPSTPETRDDSEL